MSIQTRLTGRRESYPASGCNATPECFACIRNGYLFTCSDCGKRVAWCVGGPDDERCADCWCIANKIKAVD